MGIMKEHKDELAQLQRELSHLEKTYKTGIITGDEFKASRNVVIKRINKVLAKVKNEKASQEMINEIISRKSFLDAEKTRGKIKPKTKKVVKESSENSELNKEENGLWQAMIYILVLLLIIAISFTTYRYYQVYSPENVVTIYEYTDLQSENARGVQETLRKIKDEYGEQVKIVLKHFPLEDVHPNAWLMAEALECGADQGEFETFHNFLFNYQKQLSEEMITDFAVQRNLDIEAFNRCLNTHTKQEKIQADIVEGKQKGVSAVPTFFIEDQVLVGNQKYQVFKYYIDQKLK